MRRLFFTLIGVLVAFNVFGQVEVKVSSDTVEFAQPFVFSVKVSAPENSNIAFPNLQDNLGDNLGLNKIEADTLKEKGKKTITYKLTLIPFADSVVVIKPINIVIGQNSLYTDSVVVFVKPLHVDSALVAKMIDTTQTIKIIDVTEPLKAPWTFKEFWLRYKKIILIVLALLVLGALITWIIIRRKKNKPVLPVSKPEVPAHLEALEALLVLKDKKYCEKNKYKDFYSHLSFILRRYIEKRFNIGALELTTSELKDMLKFSAVLDDDLFSKLMTLFTNADMVKFAKYEPLKNVCDKDLDFAMEFVEKTKPEEKPEETDDEQDANENESTVNNEKQ